MPRKQKTTAISPIPKFQTEPPLTFTQQERIERKQKFLINFSEYGTIYHTAKAIGIDLKTFYNWCENDQEFAAAFKSVRKIPGFIIERAAIMRAKDPKTNADPLRQFFLKNLLPEMYGEADKLSIEIKIQDVIVSHFVSLVQQNVPDTCPHCKTHLGLSKLLAEELNRMSENMRKTGAALATNTPPAA
jgi:hypothetical protein